MLFQGCIYVAYMGIGQPDLSHGGVKSIFEGRVRVGYRFPAGGVRVGYKIFEGRVRVGYKFLEGGVKRGKI